MLVKPRHWCVDCGTRYRQKSLDRFGASAALAPPPAEASPASEDRPKEHPNAVRVVHEKTREENWIPLFDETKGVPFFPDLMAELDAIKKTRIAGLMLRRDWGHTHLGRRGPRRTRLTSPT